MDKAKILKVRDALLEETFYKEFHIGFNMSTWMDKFYRAYRSKDNDFAPCDTVGCIAGLAVQMFGRNPEFPEQHVLFRAAELFDIDALTAKKLFLPAVFGFDLKDIRPVHAVRALTVFAETGVVDWTFLIEEARNGTLGFNEERVLILKACAESLIVDTRNEVYM